MDVVYVFKDKIAICFHQIKFSQGEIVFCLKQNLRQTCKEANINYLNIYRSLLKLNHLPFIECSSDLKMTKRKALNMSKDDITFISLFVFDFYI